MKKPYCKTKLSTIALILVLVISAILVTLPAVTAHDPPIEIQTYPFLAITPNPVGVDQSVYLIMWIHGAPPTAWGVGGDRYHDYTIEVTKPDESTESFGPFVSDATGSYYMMFTPDQIGQYEFTFNYDGQVISLYHPVTGVEGSEAWGGALIGDTLLPSSTTEYLTVQQDPIEKIPDYPLPSEYWTRPIEAQNSLWASVSSNWLGGAHVNHPNLFQRDGTGPNSPHIMWTKPIQFGGLVGGTTEIPGVDFYTGGSYEGRFAGSLIMGGQLYFQMPLGHSGGALASSSGYVCADLRTGEEIWFSDTIGVASSIVPPGASSPMRMRAGMKGQLFDYESMNQHGVIGGTIWEVAGSTWIAYDAFTGNWIYNITNVPVGYEVYTDKGEIVRYVLDAPGGWLALWNNTQDNVGLHGAIGTASEAYQWRTIGKEVDMSEAYSWNVSIPELTELVGTTTTDGSETGLSPSLLESAGISYVIPGDLIFGTSAQWPLVGGVLTVQESPITVWALSDNPETRGDLLWVKNIPVPTGITKLQGPADPVNRVFTLTNIETKEWYGYSLDTGELLWGPVCGVENAFSYYGSGRGAGQVGFVAYGNLYTQGFGGEIACISMKDGKVLWKYDNTNSGVEAVWPYYPIFISAIADGKVYAFNNEHSPNTPLYKDERIYCIDAFSGEELWTLMGWSGQVGGGGESTAILADGFLVYFNYYDGQIYCVGKGPSATTVSAPQTVIPKGSGVMITGSVTDQSAGAKKLVEEGKFRSVAAISDEYMGEWMEYLYMQKPCPMDITGVQVRLYAIDPNNNIVDIGTVTSDGHGMFKKMWTPPDEGEYTVVATFEGSDSYWSSYAETAIGVGPAPSPEQPITPEPQPEAPLITTEIAIILAVVAVAVIGIVGYWILKKRK